MSERLSPIPTPPALLWRQLRLQYLPVLVFVAGIFAAGFIWTQWVAPPTLVGEVEAIRAEVRSTQPGRIVGLRVDLLEPVKAGQVLGHVVAADPRVLEASLAMIRAEIELMRTTQDPIVARQRLSVDLEQLYLSWLQKRVDLASLQGQFAQAESNLLRNTALHKNKMITDELYEQSQIARDTLAEQVKSQTALVRELEPRLKHLNEGMPAPTGDAGLMAAIRHKEEELRLMEAQLGPVPLIAPIDGVVSLVLRREGEAVVPADPILQITAPEARRIVGFLREPVHAEPKPGMQVEVRTRTLQRRAGLATVAQVGQQFEPVQPSLLAAMRLPVSNVPTEYGLRVHVSMPAGLALKPGEHVDLILRD